MANNAVLFIITIVVSCTTWFHPQRFTTVKAVADDNSQWLPADATWYGNRTGAGSDGGACGYTNSVAEPPFSSLVSSGGPTLFNSGKGCGSCYEIRCNSSVEASCSGTPIRVVIADQGPGGITSPTATRFDLSGTSFGAMAKPGLADQLLNVGQLQIQYRRTTCSYPGVDLTFHVDTGANAEYFSTLIQYVSGTGELKQVYLKQASQEEWLPMEQSWGVTWKLPSSTPLKAPFCFKLVDIDNKTLVAQNVIPAYWTPGSFYKSAVTSFV
ncbi:hypothetical protein DM860_015476 [Cuscuta australis]|uniref:Expansin-like EG45 domain-containing protein n=1 Tax=Cuscuta australis TaxID=267555 RepID=A0A328EAQ3_9ASTE|nr:hypothetical protein DM860_015476 [Cuscuta australis]